MKQCKRILISAACIALCVTFFSCNNAFHEATGATSSGGGTRPGPDAPPVVPPSSETYTLSVDWVTGQSATEGTVSATHSTGIASGTSVTVTAVPDAGYTFIKWVNTNSTGATAVSPDAAYTFNITQNTTLYAVFAPKHTLAVAVEGTQTGWGTAADDTNAAPYDHNQSVTVSATAAGGYTFIKWVATNSAAAVAVSTDNPYTFGITEPTTLFAVFALKHTLSVGVEGNQTGWGTAADDTSTAPYDHNQSVTVSATPQTGYTFVKWVATDSAAAVAVSTDNPYTFGITGPTTLYAVFTKYTVTISAADTYYDNFATALTAAIAASGSTLTLHADAPATAAQAALTSTTLTIQTTTAGGPWKIPLSGTGSLFTLGSGATLNLAEKIVLEGIGGNNAALVTVNSGGSLSMSGSASVTGNTGGGGVYINGGEFTMSGSASITGNTGSGVCIVNSGQFTMNAGTISGNTGANVGGGVCINNGIFAMNGGTIGGGNSATFGGGVNIDNNGTFNLNSPATLSDITGNTATIGGKGHKVYKTSAASFNIDSIPVTSGWTNTHGSNPYWD